MTVSQSIGRRCHLALREIDALAVNMVHDVRSLEARLERAGLGLAVLAYPELRIIEASAECIRAELIEARAADAPCRPLTRWRPSLRALMAVGALALAGGRIWRRRSSTH